jgi:hypothetical protein
MKISELPQEVKEKALEYQRNADENWDKNTDNLEYAFDWQNTNEEEDYWSECNRWSAPEIIMYSEEEVFKLINEYFNDAMSGCNLRAKEWFNKFKK